MEKDYFMLYPVYLDSSKKLSEGRKYNKNMCINHPQFREIYEALKYLSIESIPESDKIHPRDCFRPGRFKIKKMYGKKQVIDGIIQIIKEGRIRMANASNKSTSTVVVDKSQINEFITTSKGEVIENKLNLVPKKKSKQKKGKKK